MDTPDEIRYNQWWEKEGRYIEEAKHDHPCYSCKGFDECNRNFPDLEFDRCEYYEEE